jgi:hypothetical protein
LWVVYVGAGDAPVLTLLGSVSLKELKFFLEAGNLLVCLFLIECPLSDKLSSQVLYLLNVASLNGISLLPHHSTPYAIQFVENLRYACLGHGSIECLLNLLDSSHCFGGYPLVLQVRTM